jgi:dihydrofolate reductase
MAAGMTDPQPQRLRAMIYARSHNDVIGEDGHVPWKYSGDMKRFKRLTMGGVVIMGRKTYESIGRALPGRVNIVLSSTPIAVSASSSVAEQTSIQSVRTIELALARAEKEPISKAVWFIGGAKVYAAAMAYVDLIDETIIPMVVEERGLPTVHAPSIDEDDFEPGPLIQHEDDAALMRRTFTRRAGR